MGLTHRFASIEQEKSGRKYKKWGEKVNTDPL
jgi:hypothetical protein